MNLLHLRMPQEESHHRCFLSVHHGPEALYLAAASAGSVSSLRQWIPAGQQVRIHQALLQATTGNFEIDISRIRVHAATTS